MSALDEAKAALTVTDAWNRLGLPGEPRKSCSSPFREDRSPSFSVYEGGHRWKDHSTGKGGDVCDFVAAALNVTLANAARWILEQTNARATARAWPKVRSITPAEPKPPQPRKPLALPPLEKGTVSDFAQLQELRGFRFFAGLQILSNRGQLGFATLKDGAERPRCWIITDDSRRNAQARRLDGKAWQSINAKAKTLPGSQAAWPIGASRIGNVNTILFTEGAPDLLAAATFAAFDLPGSFEAVAMIGAGLNIHPEALPLFKGKDVFIFAHNDEAGLDAARRWRDQLTEAGATVTTLCSDAEGRDLNDTITAGEKISLI